MNIYHQKHSTVIYDDVMQDVQGLEFVYVSGRVRAKGEMNGKSGNVNNLCSQLYPPGLPIPGNEVLCVFDADQVGGSALWGMIGCGA